MSPCRYLLILLDHFEKTRSGGPAAKDKKGKKKGKGKGKSNLKTGRKPPVGSKDGKNGVNPSAPFTPQASRLISALLTGITRAIPYASRTGDRFDEHIDGLFRIARVRGKGMLLLFMGDFAFFLLWRGFKNGSIFTFTTDQ